MTEKSFYSSRQPLLLPPPSSLVLSPPPHLHQQVRTAIGQNFMVIFFQSGIQAKPLGFFQLLPHPPIPCNSSYFYVDHDQPDLYIFAEEVPAWLAASHLCAPLPVRPTPARRT